MFKKVLFPLILCFSFNLSCDNLTLEKIVNNDKVQSVVAGAVSAYIRPMIVDYFKDQPVRAGAITSMIFLAHGLNIFRNDKDRVKRLIASIFGAATTAFIRNK